MKKLLVLLLCLALVLSFAGCGVKEKIENKVGQVVGEKVVEGLSEGKVDVSGDKVTIKGENGAEVTFGATDWPKSDLVKNIPVFTQGKIVSVMDSENYSMIIMEEVDEKDFTNYYNDIKQKFTTDSYEMKTEQNVSYGATDGKGFTVQVSYEYGSKTFSIVASQAEKQ